MSHGTGRAGMSSTGRIGCVLAADSPRRQQRRGAPLSCGNLRGAPCGRAARERISAGSESPGRTRLRPESPPGPGPARFAVGASFPGGGLGQGSLRPLEIDRFRHSRRDGSRFRRPSRTACALAGSSARGPGGGRRSAPRRLCLSGQRAPPRRGTRAQPRAGRRLCLPGPMFSIRRS